MDSIYFNLSISYSPIILAGLTISELLKKYFSYNAMITIIFCLSLFFSLLSFATQFYAFRISQEPQHAIHLSTVFQQARVFVS